MNNNSCATCFFAKGDDLSTALASTSAVSIRHDNKDLFDQIE
jgi:hypothetical protein